MTTFAFDPTVPAQLQDWLVDRVAEYLPELAEPVDPHRELGEYGLDSIAVVAFAADVEERSVPTSTRPRYGITRPWPSSPSTSRVSSPGARSGRRPPDGPAVSPGGLLRAGGHGLSVPRPVDGHKLPLDQSADSSTRRRTNHTLPVRGRRSPGFLWQPRRWPPPGRRAGRGGLSVHCQRSRLTGFLLVRGGSRKQESPHAKAAPRKPGSERRLQTESVRRFTSGRIRGSHEVRSIPEGLRHHRRRRCAGARPLWPRAAPTPASPAGRLQCRSSARWCPPCRRSRAGRTSRVSPVGSEPRRIPTRMIFGRP